MYIFCTTSMARARAGGPGETLVINQNQINQSMYSINLLKNLSLPSFRLKIFIWYNFAFIVCLSVRLILALLFIISF